ncbi:crotonase/enoyl-CoA hydratase family protein [Tomitella fengzijianii]|uniref:Crotonase/enoyl-CoA hydratase family protein n=2 Tax=Tomitella fengzijianii TaxID=2597660 RepID=A0A516X3G1_9ACTN|nr:crotonase/enoyl-CoA hydratase family protein [Tomitella fengzijianii]QDQ97553.1 crotonase/enoyl-CoA hydratase family protein [Tomitella fengzijianii]
MAADNGIAGGTGVSGDNVVAGRWENSGRPGFLDIAVSTDGYVTTVTMARPDRRNAVDGRMAAELAEAFRAFERSDSRVAVLHGEGGTFCAGADLKTVGTTEGNRIGTDGDGPMGITRMRLDKPVIAAVSGYAVAGGLELAAWCDMRVADESAVFGVFCRRWGVPLIDGGTVRLPRLIGQSRAMDMVLTGRPVPAAEAEYMGLVNRLVPDGTALAYAQDLAARIAEFPQTCMRGDRMSVLAQWGSSERDAMAEEFAIGMRSLEADGIDGAGRFAGGAGRHGSFD